MYELISVLSELSEAEELTRQVGLAKLTTQMYSDRGGGRPRDPQESLEFSGSLPPLRVPGFVQRENRHAS